MRGASSYLSARLYPRTSWHRRERQTGGRRSDDTALRSALARPRCALGLSEVENRRSDMENPDFVGFGSLDEPAPESTGAPVHPDIIITCSSSRAASSGCFRQGHGQRACSHPHVECVR